MTNKYKMALCPMPEVKRYLATGGMLPLDSGCGEGIFVASSDFDRLAEIISRGQEEDTSRVKDDDGCPNEIAVLKRFWRSHQVSAAPAEDVRAMVDEPTLFVAADAIADIEQVGMHATRGSNAVQTIPLYRHAQRKTVMPDFNEWYVRTNAPIAGTCNIQSASWLWRACIDEFKRLNGNQP